MKKRVLSIILCLAILASFLTFGATGVQADRATSLDVYVQYANQSAPTLVHHYTQAEFEGLSQTTEYYTAIDSMPSDVHNKGTGVLLSTLISHLQTNYDPNISFISGSSLNVYCTDTEPDSMLGPGTDGSYTYEYLLGSQRYNYPNLYITKSINNLDMSGSAAIEPIFAVSSIENSTSKCRHYTRTQIDSETPVTDAAYKFCFGLTPGDVTGKTITAKYNAKYVDRIDIIEPYSVYTATFSSNGSTHITLSAISGNTISAPPAPTLDGYIFNGWYTDATFTTQVTFPCALTGDVTYYAYWSENTSPTPELPAAVLFGLGAAGIGGFLVIRRNKQDRRLA
jgi:uncharacterized repeat protein (TIGR02543 family)